MFLNSQRYGCVEIINYALSTLEKNELELESYQEAMDSREKEMVTSNERENEFSEEKWDLDYGETTWSTKVSRLQMDIQKKVGNFWNWITKIQDQTCS